ncbi:MAG: sensor histidine kinase [Akkermansiaceae bacterium]
MKSPNAHDSLPNMLNDSIKRKTLPRTALLLSALFALACTGAAADITGQKQITQLEQELAGIDSKLKQLANYHPRSGIGVGGFRSKRHRSPDQREWIEIDLGGNHQIDEIILVPEIWRDTDTRLHADGFPEEFHILAGAVGDREGKVIASYTRKDNLLPRIAPLVVPCGGVEASWIRLEATLLGPRAWDEGYALHLFEILAFSGPVNVALHQPVRASSQNVMGSGKYDKAFIVDGLLPYLMDAAKGQRSQAFLAECEPGTSGHIVIDLGEPHSLDQLHLHAIDLSDTIPQKWFNNFAIPRHFIAEGGSDPDFGDAHILAEFRVKSVFDVGPIMMEKFPAHTCRYVRLRVIEPGPPSWGGEQIISNVGFAEVALFSDGVNVAQGALTNGSYQLKAARSYAAITDGRNFYGDILPIRDWLGELALRHELEAQRPGAALRLAELYDDQAKLLNRLIILAIALAAGIVFSLLSARIIRIRQIHRIRERLAADLHDELGANLQTIGLLSDLALDSRDDDAAFSDIHRRIRSESERSGAEVRSSMDLLSVEGFCVNLEQDMRRAARRIMAKLQHALVIEGESWLKKLKPRIRVDLFLFYKECLVNISRHSGATAFSSQLSADSGGVTLSIQDNGIGINQRQEGLIPKSLERRARLLGASISVASPAEGGTLITLTIPARQRGGLGIFKSIYQ